MAVETVEPNPVLVVELSEMSFSIKILGPGNKKEIQNNELEHYIRLIRPYASLSLQCLKTSSGKYSNRHEALQREEKLIIHCWPDRSYPVALSEEGKLFDSHSFSQWLSERIMSGITVLFNIGGAYGLSPSLKKRCKEVISLSSMTLPHRLCYVILVEQLYRAFTILRGHPYHK